MNHLPTKWHDFEGTKLLMLDKFKVIGTLKVQKLLGYESDAL